MPFPSILLYFFAIFCAFPSADGWAQYEVPLRIGPTSPSGLFEFELTVEPKLSMSVEHEHGDLSVHDYEPKRMVWTEREKGQLRPCLEQRELLSVSQTAPYQCQRNRSLVLRELELNTERTMPGLIQFNGRHKWLNAVNAQSPGPTLVVKDGSEVLVRIKNRLLLQSLTLHFHGQTMDNLWFLDGVAPLQQCPLGVRSDFEFRFTAHSVGTHFYRGQFPAGHQSDGLLGAFVVLPKDSGEQREIHFQKDYVAILQDWPLVPSWEQEDQWEEGSAQFRRGMHGEFDGPPKTEERKKDGVWAILINSKGWHSREDIRRKPHKLPWATFRVDEGDKMRFRLIHGGFRHPLVVHIEKHQMEVIATDGNEVEPIRTDALILYPGERFDLRVAALKFPRWPIHRMVVGLAEQFLAKVDDPIFGLANLDYHSLGKAIDPNWDGSKVDFLLNRCTARQCLLMGCPFQTENGTFTTSDRRNFKCHSVDKLNSNGKLNIYSSRQKRADDAYAVERHQISLDSDKKTVNGFRFKMPAAVGPFSTRNGAAVAEALRRGNCSLCSNKNGATPCECFFHKRFPHGKTIEITFVNKNSPASANFGVADAIHRSLSVHLHGIRFDVLQIATPELTPNGTVNISPLNTSPKIINQRNETTKKVEKDTILVPYGGHTVIRFQAENRGWWIAETNQNGRGAISFAFAIGDDNEMPKGPEKLPAECNNFDPGTDIYAKF